jgi:signal peptidase II
MTRFETRARAVLLCLLLIGTAACDRATKHFALTSLAGAADQSFLADTVRLTYHENTGALLGVGADWRPGLRLAWFQIGNGLVLLAAVILAARRGRSRLGNTGLLLFVAGGASNLIDRVAMGRVVDFLNVGIGPLRTGIFNVADMAIIAGVVILIVEAVRNTYTPTVSNSQA